MAIKDITMPALGMAQTTGIIVEWSKNIGDSIEIDDIILLIETDKSVMEIPSTDSGVMVSITGAVGVPIDVGSVIAKIETEKANAEKSIQEFEQSEFASKLAGNIGQKQVTKVVAEPIELIKQSEKRKPDKAIPNTKKEAINTTPFKMNRGITGSKVLASPKAKNAAESRGIQIEELAKYSQLVQPYNSDDVYSYISWKETNDSNINSYLINIVAEINLEKFIQILESQVDHQETSRGVHLLVKIVSSLISNNKILGEYFRNPTIDLDITEILQDSYEEYSVENCEQFMHSYGLPVFEARKIGAGICVEYFEHEQIVEFNMLEREKLAVRLFVQAKKKIARVFIDSNIDVLDRETLLHFANTLCKMLENPLLLLM